MTELVQADALVEVTQADRDAVTRFHAAQMARIMAGDRTLGENRDAIEQAFARHRLAHQPTTDAEAEPVAWQRNHPVTGWMDCHAEDVAHYHSVGQEVRPLYAHQPADKARIAELEAALRRSDEIVRRNNHRQNEKVDDVRVIVARALENRSSKRGEGR